MAMAQKHKIFPQSFNDVLATNWFNGAAPTASASHGAGSRGGSSGPTSQP
jgi:hypothetical protein